MPYATLRIIRDEHAALAAMVKSILLLLAQHRRQGTLPDFADLRAMLLYLDEFPEKRHHRKESELLFPKLHARTPLSRALLAYRALFTRIVHQLPAPIGLGPVPQRR